MDCTIEGLDSKKDGRDRDDLFPALPAPDKSPTPWGAP
jgi:hypothetical protein